MRYGFVTQFWRAVIGLLTAVILAALWLFPILAFSHPGINEAIQLAGLGPLVLLLVGLATLLSLILAALQKCSSDLPLSLGLLLLMAGLAAAVGMAVFGEMDNDRFMALLFPSPPSVIAGMLVVGLAWGVRRRAPGQPVAALLRGGIAGFVVGAWLLARGAREWTHAPYGFDWFTLIALAAIVLTLREARSPQVPPESRPGGGGFPAPGDKV